MVILTDYVALQVHEAVIIYSMMMTELYYHYLFSSISFRNVNCLTHIFQFPISRPNMMNGWCLLTIFDGFPWTVEELPMAVVSYLQYGLTHADVCLF